MLILKKRPAAALLHKLEKCADSVSGVRVVLYRINENDGIATEQTVQFFFFKMKNRHFEERNSNKRLRWQCGKVGCLTGKKSA